MMSKEDLDEYHNIGKPVKWNSKFTYPKSSRSLVMGRRHYAVDNKKLPSVTTILSHTQSKEKQDSLAAWQARVGKDKQRGSRTKQLHVEQLCIPF